MANFNINDKDFPDDILKAFDEWRKYRSPALFRPMNRTVAIRYLLNQIFTTDLQTFIIEEESNGNHS